MRTTAAASKTLTSSMRALTLSSRPAALPAVQTRCLSQAALTGVSSRMTKTMTTVPSGAAAPAAAVQRGVAAVTTQQVRGMKVRSAIKKRCEHCKVSGKFWVGGLKWGVGNVFGRVTCEELGLMSGFIPVLQVVRRKANKRHNGYLYIVCPANPRHKQRQG